MGHKHTREDLLAGALAATRDEGLSRLTFGRLAKRLGVSDRVIVYYFPTKDDLIGSVLVAIAGELQGALADVVSDGLTGHGDLVKRAWPVLSSPEHDRVFALFFEATGLAAAGLAPYDGVVPELVEAWIQWAASMLDGAAGEEARRAEAEASIALVDGLLLLRQLRGVEVADRAAAALGVS
ncbi:MAG: TetR/AcrR family transcriptional regulator [Actinomycetota bacterium]